MKLSEILRRAGSGTGKESGAEITGLENNSSRIRPGNIFVAVKGSRLNGADYIGQAVERGAAAVITDSANRNYVDASKYPGVDIVFVDDIRRVESKLASILYPRAPGFIAAVTGTNGKSSAVNFCRQMWEFLEIPAASIGTLGVHTSNSIGKKTLTTPDAIDLHKNLDELALEGITHLALETSSHGIEQKRADAIRISAAGFTNISNDHLDYHKNIEDYFKAKLRLFSELLDPSGTAVINMDDPRGAAVRDVCSARGIRVIAYGKESACDIRLGHYRIENGRQQIGLDIFGKRFELELDLVTEFQIYNLMCALGLFIAGTPEWERAMPHLGRLQNEKGRIEYVGQSPNGAKIYVDFGHNGDGLKKLLTEFRPHVKQNLICIAGCSGDRPEIRRIEIGKVLNEYADQVVIVDDNPRTEDPKSIRETILEYCPKAKAIPDRYAAIGEIIDVSRDWDAIIICGTMYEKDKEFIRAKLAPKAMSLKDLCKAAGIRLEGPGEKAGISGISNNSKTVKDGDAFVGINGFKQNGADFAADAIARGARAVVVEDGYEFDARASAMIREKGIAAIHVPNPRKAFADLAYNFHGKMQPENIVAVTGTSGKSSVVDFGRQMWGLSGARALSAGTIGLVVENVYSEKRTIECAGSHYTTPASDDMYRYLAYFKEKGVEYGAVELSSHGLDQYRLANIKIKAAGFTNLGTDHMDFYGGADGYLKSKARLFEESVDDGGTAVLNADIAQYEYLRQACERRGLRVWTYGRAGKEFKIISQDVSLEGQEAELEIFGTRRRFELSILGSFQLWNLMCALGLFASVTPGWEKILAMLGRIKNAPGRLEYMGKTKKGASIYIDFSYKGDALEHTLKTLRAMASGKLVAVFSTCGDVYETRRREELGRAAQEHSDIAILTDDSPRFEDAQKIRAEVLAFCPKAIEVKTGRKDAIRKAFELAGAGDAILIAGKGHEDYVTIKDVDIPYTDQRAVKELLDEGL